MDRQIIDYTVTQQTTVKALIESVAQYIQMGWEPLGGIAHTSIGSGMYGFTQAVVKYAYAEPEGKTP